MSPKKKLGPQHKNSVTKAWLQFQEDIEAAMLRKPGGGSGLYKNLTDLMQDRMDQLDQVKVPINVCYLSASRASVIEGG